MRLAAALLLAPLLAACSSSAPSPEEVQDLGPVRITFRQLRNGAEFELVNETHTDRVEQYSQVQTSAARKVTTDEVAGGLLAYFDDNGWADLEIAGSAPRAAQGSLYTMEVERDGRVSHVIERAGIPVDERARLRQLFQAFLEVYNMTWGAQAVQVAPGEDPFQAPGR